MSDLPVWVFPVLNYRVVDGDTVKMTVDTGFHTRREMYCRIYRLDTPEVNKARQRDAGHAVRSVVEQWMKNQETLKVHSIAEDPFNPRFVGKIYGDNDEELANFILSRGLGKYYNGKEKKEWLDESLDSIKLIAPVVLGELVDEYRRKKGVGQDSEGLE